MKLQQKTTKPLISTETSSGSSIFAPSQSSQDTNPTQPTVTQALVELLEEFGVKSAFGVSGGGIGPMWATLEHSLIKVLHFRHEAGAAFAAVESYFATNRPTVVFTTTGPGITNALTGLLAARGDGAKVIFLSASTSAVSRGRAACQETSTYNMPSSGLFTSGPLFHYATTVESSEQLPEVALRLALGLAQPEGFVAHVSIPTAIQTSLLNAPLAPVKFSRSLPTAGEDAIAECIRLLSQKPFAIWVGFGARNAATEIKQLAERTGAAVMCSPRAKGIFPESHPQYLGVTGFSGHETVLNYMESQRPDYILVLGTRLGEPTSFWSPAMLPNQGFIHVDIDPEVPGTAYPTANTFAIHSEIKVFVKNLLRYFPSTSCKGNSRIAPTTRQSSYGQIPFAPTSLVRPEILMDAIQKVIVEGSDAIVMAEAGNSFAWATHHLKFDQPYRYRISTGVGAMGHAATGVVGAALGWHDKAIAIAGDGAMLMNSEINTAVKYEAPAVWIVLNDARYNMCDQGMNLQGLKGIDAHIPPADFVKIAQGMGADGIRVEKESDLEAALAKAMAATIPFVVDVIIDPTFPSPIAGRVKSLMKQGAK
ncbi:Acetolactate synthase [Stanieria cyanosphaera PCC 7437]|uniref:Acetolactate synthase n=1 Tax=Stanieria cyanosphaera (strain ATCC 29371 / PCC 7437) TaxID=111780 RepID=K9XP28_STAC7|nr:ScyA-related TPP-binding enzyme [Stanieria cyanosphaera]AFZ33839.1 Acetolactate synthase [Stanieria cyanosphaera PCC 7437]